MGVRKQARPAGDTSRVSVTFPEKPPVDCRVMVEVAEEPSSKANEPPFEAKLKLATALAVWIAPTQTAIARTSIAHPMYPDSLDTHHTTSQAPRAVPSQGGE